MSGCEKWCRQDNAGTAPEGINISGCNLEMDYLLLRINPGCAIVESIVPWLARHKFSFRPFVGRRWRKTALDGNLSLYKGSNEVPKLNSNLFSGYELASTRGAFCPNPLPLRISFSMYHPSFLSCEKSFSPL